MEQYLSLISLGVALMFFISGNKSPQNQLPGHTGRVHWAYLSEVPANRWLAAPFLFLSYCLVLVYRFLVSLIENKRWHLCFLVFRNRKQIFSFPVSGDKVGVKTANIQVVTSVSCCSKQQNMQGKLGFIIACPNSAVYSYKYIHDQLFVSMRGRRFPYLNDA